MKMRDCFDITFSRHMVREADESIDKCVRTCGDTADSSCAINAKDIDKLMTLTGVGASERLIARLR